MPEEDVEATPNSDIRRAPDGRMLHHASDPRSERAQPRGATICCSRYVPHSAQMWCRSLTLLQEGQSMVAAVKTRWSWARRMRLRDLEVRFFGTAMTFSQ